ncbi:MAG: ATP-binding cassette domain-containing protein [Anaerolineae bacterium]|nr:ATP-binding cassette domain-containing protein [Anaerolineae bacterium]
MDSFPLLCARDLRLAGIGQNKIALDLNINTRVGLLGAAGSGKTQLLRTLARLDTPQSGTILWENVKVSRRPRWLLGKRRTLVVLVLSNPYTAFEPWAKVEHMLTSPRKNENRIKQLFQTLSLSLVLWNQRVGALSGVQRTTLALARALLNNPRVLLVDDVFDMLTPEVWPMLVQQIIQGAGTERTVLIASRHWPVLQSLDYVFVLKEGDIIESGSPHDLVAYPRHPYTQALIAQYLEHQKY